MGLLEILDDKDEDDQWKGNKMEAEIAQHLEVIRNLIAIVIGELFAICAYLVVKL